MSTHGHRKDPHLDGLVAAVVDGVLDHDARERALGHLARCDDCRAEVEAQRRLKARLARMAAPEVPGGLAERLLRLPDGVPDPAPAPGPALPPVRVVASFRLPRPRSAAPRRASGRERSTRSRPVVTATRRTGEGRRSRRGRTRSTRGRHVAGAAAGGLAVFALSLATVMALGAPDRPQRVVPAVDSYTIEHSRTAVGVPGADPLDVVDLVRTGVR